MYPAADVALKVPYPFLTVSRCVRLGWGCAQVELLDLWNDDEVVRGRPSQCFESWHLHLSLLQLLHEAGEEELIDSETLCSRRSLSRLGPKPASLVFLEVLVAAKDLAQ